MEATPLHLAACCLQPHVVRWLLENGADPSTKADGQTAADIIETVDLFASARLQRPEDLAAVKALLEASAD